MGVAGKWRDPYQWITLFFCLEWAGIFAKELRLEGHQGFTFGNSLHIL